ncbi:UDP-4-amino-4,6-dideoxy-N-acetyl-beta-L-altrosamine N-acetyltransferase [bacterium]|nr:MAG: UDP-4-amino-4,6-dideoxy-N-acetyl-beta-L-altrosamine N-acetyltransferase [bacterium]
MIRREAYRLRPVMSGDLEMLLTWRNAPHVRRWMFTTHLISREEHQAWHEQLQGSESTQVLIFECSGEPLGVVQFADIRRDLGCCSWGFYLAAAEPPRGTGTKLGVLALDYAFDGLDVRALRAQVLIGNERSLAFHRKLGFREEEALVQRVLEDGRRENVKVLELLRDHWHRSKERVERSAFGKEGR